MRAQPERTWHNIQPNETTRIPRRHIFLDSEARHARRGKTGIQTWRLAVACYSIGRKGYETKDEWREYKTSQRLWADINTFTASEPRTVLWAHNLGYDIRISDAFTELPKLGWKLTGHNITARSTWLEWRKDKATLLMVDSVSFFNTTIAQMGEWHGIGKVNIELDSDDDRDWFTRCRTDVRILSVAVKAYLDWLERGDMGNWQITGAAQSWATYRHKHLTHKLTVHDDRNVLAMERRAMWTGRCEAYWRGEIKGERVYEFDFKAAYPRIARDNSVPTKLLGPMPSGYRWEGILGSNKSALLARVRVDTEQPVVPCLLGGRILWPRGRFETTLWDVEIKEAIEAGARVHVLDGYLYRKAPALSQWGQWILEQLAESDEAVPAWQKAIYKHWSRALIGRFAMTYNEWTDWGDATESNTMRGTILDVGAGEKYEIMQVGKQIWQDEGRQEWQNSMPMITGYIQAIGRVQLWQVLQQLPERSAIYVDTDSILCTGAHVEQIAEIAANYSPGELRLKRAWDGFAIYGPRQIVTGEQVRVSGVPRMAKRVDKHTFEGEVWDTLVGAIRNGATNSVVTRDRTWRIEGVDNRRTSTGFGWTKPIHINE